MERLSGILLHPRRLVVTRRRIRKKRPTPLGSHRTVIELPSQEFLDAYRNIRRRLERFLVDAVPGFPLDCVHGYVRDRGTRTNAAQHCEARYLVRLDLAAFFPSITAAMLGEMFRKLGMSPVVVSHIVSAVTFEGALVEGLPTSPLLANLAAHAMDTEIVGWVSEQSDESLRYTRYGDDLTLSSRQRHPPIDPLESIVRANGFELNHHKSTRSVPGQAHFVTGLSVNTSRPRIPKRLKRLLRQHAHHIDRVGLVRHAQRCGLRPQAAVHFVWGLLSYVAAIEPDVASIYRPTLVRRIAEAGLPRWFPGKRGVLVDDVTLVVDETSSDTWSAVCVVDVVDKLRAECAVREFVEAALADPGTVDPSHSLSRVGLHFTDNHQDTRTGWIKKMETLPVRAYVAYSRRRWSYDLYLELLGKVFFALRPWSRAKSMRILVEQMSVPDQATAVSRIANEAVPQLGYRDAPAVEIVGKEEPLVAFPDYLLAVLRLAIAQRNSGRNGAQSAAQLKRLWDKYRLVVDVDNGKWFSRRFPLCVDKL